MAMRRGRGREVRRRSADEAVSRPAPPHTERTGLNAVSRATNNGGRPRIRPPRTERGRYDGGRREIESRNVQKQERVTERVGTGYRDIMFQHRVHAKARFVDRKRTCRYNAHDDDDDANLHRPMGVLNTNSAGIQPKASHYSYDESN